MRRASVPAALLAVLIASSGGGATRHGSDGLASTPATAEIDSAALRSLDADIAQGKYGFVDSLYVVRCDHVAFERYYERDYATIYGEQAKRKGPLNAHGSGPYDYFDATFHPYFRGTAGHTMQSVTKTITAVIIGVARNRGDFKSALDTPVLDYFKGAAVRNVDARKRRMTLEHVLTMTTGLDWDEDAPYESGANTAGRMEASADWVQYAIDRPMSSEPGKVFAYSSGASELLAYVFRRETGQDIEEYARRELFGPLGFQDVHWKRTPTGVADTEGGLYLRTQDLAKIGLLLLHDGLWGGRRMVSTEWIRESMRPRVAAGEGYHYGYQVWLRSTDSPQQWIWSARGFGGQYLLVAPDRDLLLVVTGWNLLKRSSIEREALDRLLAGTSPGGCPHQLAE